MSYPRHGPCAGARRDISEDRCLPFPPLCRRCGFHGLQREQAVNLGTTWHGIVRYRTPALRGPTREVLPVIRVALGSVHARLPERWAVGIRRVGGQDSAPPTFYLNRAPGTMTDLPELLSRDWQLPDTEFSALLQGSRTWRGKENINKSEFSYQCPPHMFSPQVKICIFTFYGSPAIFFPRGRIPLTAQNQGPLAPVSSHHATQTCDTHEPDLVEY